jgi:hypothetical protein
MASRPRDSCGVRDLEAKLLTLFQVPQLSLPEKHRIKPATVQGVSWTPTRPPLAARPTTRAMPRSTMKRIYFVRTRPVTHGDLATLLEMLGEGVAPLHKRESGEYGNGGIAYTTTEPEHKYKYVKFTGADLPDTFTPGSGVVLGEYTEPVWTASNRFHIEVVALGMNFGDTSGLCAAIKAALGCMDLRDVKALERAAPRAAPSPPAPRAVLPPREQLFAAALAALDAEGDIFGEGVRAPAPPAPPAPPRARRAKKKPSRAQRFKAAHAACEAQGDSLAGWGAPAPDPAWAARHAAALEEIEAEGPVFG